MRKPEIGRGTNFLEVAQEFAKSLSMENLLKFAGDVSKNISAFLKNGLRPKKNSESQNLGAEFFTSLLREMQKNGFDLAAFLQIKNKKKQQNILTEFFEKMNLKNFLPQKVSMPILITAFLVFISVFSISAEKNLDGNFEIGASTAAAGDLNFDWGGNGNTGEKTAEKKPKPKFEDLTPEEQAALFVTSADTIDIDFSKTLEEATDVLKKEPSKKKKKKKNKKNKPPKIW